MKRTIPALVILRIEVPAGFRGLINQKQMILLGNPGTLAEITIEGEGSLEGVALTHPTKATRMTRMRRTNRSLNQR